MPKLNKVLKLDEFLNPRSMLTPGVAGGLTMILSSSFSTIFHCEMKLAVLVISFALSLLVVLGMKNVPLLERIIYCFLNTLIIFSMSYGAGKLYFNFDTL